ncbi:MAG: hypothetical protein U9Q89_06575, partial [Thermodesulfobacteriota bacterium]|nr:hypothetical protein [Thermodesulfobacteriota bacterium]
ATKGKIRLALRRTGDAKTVATKGVTASDLISRSAKRAYKKRAYKKKTPKKIVEVIKGSNVSTQSF